MDETLPDDRAITVPVPAVNLTVEDRFQNFEVSEISHVVVQLSDKRLDSIMQSCASLTYNFDKPWPFWFFIGKTLSKVFFENILDPTKPNHIEEELRVVEVDFSKPIRGEDLKAFWKSGREITCQRVREWLEYLRRNTPK
ncbi:uncharacterized protein BO80DRAFT_455224 [Aspergillus ibericus CBS 121593]|uniref:Uncharacterized protein n=1 Tax=Aspergillus ibericus CBS 121593 TaxID=1448316 RepID=A0A395GZU1_9EURO|nr:hypothetical protein BO80DRAFT_455224 [Aspergillus ibericus CBS 121593]RAL01111.1 hypothetical protein BO80DRAFT_455224 [Aspergillus ibericus CBS 121593]